MRRLGFSLLILLLLAACSSAPQRVSRSSGSYSTASSGSAYHTPPPGFPNFVDHSVGREEISIQAMSLVGIPYRWGGNTPDSGFDCSGLVRYVVARSASVNLPRTTADMSGSGESIEPDEVAPGDLIFFNTTGRPHSHVGIYVGKLRFVNAPSTGGTVRIDYLTNPYWAKRFDGIRRVAAPTHAPAPFEAPTYQVSNPPERMAAPVEPQESSAGYAGMGSSQQPVAESRSGYGYAAAPEPVAAPVQSQQTFQPQRVATTMQAPLTTSAIQPAPQSAAAPSADAFEPPPPVMSAAQMQAREAGAVTPTAVSSGTLRTQTDTGGMGTVSRVPAATANADTADAPVRSPVPASVARAPDPIDAAADAFEPPPPASVAVRQEQQAGPSGGVQIMRASTGSRAIPAPTQSGDDPIAHFATGNF
ncbi:C40 family peptidase [Paraburkholderia sp. BCC1885]|uniref:C40 family peptidase n=1 Tax=Paraburkholderia sp. BCC1885 TaxID=2562669 RepID=UPI0011831A81|nr:C40 family peptidase [Paraburkholderia sp. BCC1885]